MEDEEAAREKARQAYFAACDAAKVRYDAAVWKAEEAYLRFVRPYRRAFYDAIEEAGKEHVA